MRKAQLDPLADGILLVCCLFWGLTTVVIRTTQLAHVSAEKLLFYQLAVSALLIPLMSLAWGEVWLNESVTPGLLAALTMVAVGIVLMSRKRVAA